MKTLLRNLLNAAFLAVFFSLLGVSGLQAQSQLGRQPEAAEAKPARIGTITIKFVGMANVSEQIVRANMVLREDTDLAWRVLSFGRIPFASDVVVVHPALPKEAEPDRTHFFVHDALLYFKHPDRYVALMRAEGHHLHTPGFWQSVEAGVSRHGVPVSVEALRAALSVRS